MTLAIEHYDHAESEAMRSLSFEEIMAFSTKTFDQLGFPARVSDESELIRYADWNFDLGNQEYFRPGIFIRGASTETVFTVDEAQMINRLCDHVVQLTSILAGRSVRPLCNPIAQIGLFRIISALKSIYGLNDLSVFEVGPGSGYLGALLAVNGYRYASIDNAQALYLWQNRLLQSLCGEDFAEWVSSTDDPQARVIHFPWWQYVRMYDRMPISSDIVVSNANLGEMSNRALRYTIAFSKKLLANSKIKLLIYTNVGDPKQNTVDTIEGYLRAAGFERVFEKLFNGWILRDGPIKLKRNGLEDRIPLFNPSRDESRLAAVDFLFLPPEQWPLDLGFTRVVQDWAPPVATDENAIDPRYRSRLRT